LEVDAGAKAGAAAAGCMTKLYTTERRRERPGV